jgi:alkaline phosphatase D
MSEQLRTESGPWCGALTDTAVTIRASVFQSVARARVIVAEDASLSTGAHAFDASTLWVDPGRDYRHKIATFMPHDLRPDTNYFFKVELDGDTSRALPGRFRTAPKMDDAAGFRFALAGCAKTSFPGGKRCPEPYQAIADMPGLLFFFHLGDFHYANIGDDEIVPRLEAYDGTLRHEMVGDLFRQLPIAYCWDDHDFLGNNAAGGNPSNASARRAARDAYDIHVPHYPFAEIGEGIHQSFQIGRVLFLLTDSRFAKSPRGRSGTSGKTVLGVNQKAWLKAQLLRGKDLDLTVWASSFPWIGHGDPHEDFWAGYAAEREELAEFVQANGVRNLCMISADAHMLAIDDGSHSGYAPGGRGGFPVFQAGALESSGSEKGGPYSIGEEGGGEGPGLGHRRQFGVFEVAYDGTSTGPRVIWTGYRAEKGTAKAVEMIRHEFPARETFAGF